jgi:hypothetical protein
MRIALADLPQPILERLKAIQANPRSYDCFYKKEPGRGGAIFGLVVVGLSLLSAFGIVASQYVAPPVMVVAGILLGAITFYSISRIRRFGRSPLRPMMVLNPLYLVRANLDWVSYHFIWSELTDLKITHHYTNGAYTNTIFAFKFKHGAESISVAPKKVADQLADVIESYRQRMIQALENKDYDSFVAHDLFLELRDQEEAALQKAPATQKAVGRRHLMAWAAGGGIGAVAAFLLSGVSYASAQSRQIEYCSGVESCEYYFTRWAVPVYKGRAQQKLLDEYRRRWERDKKSARTLREMAAIEKAPYLQPAQEKEVLALYKDGSQRELRGLYQQAIERYRSVSAGGNPAARDAIIKLLELARDKGLHHVRMTYKGITEKVRDIPPSKATNFRTPVPMSPSFSDELNKSRESLITDRISRAFLTIVPQDILEFPGSASASASSHSYRSPYRYSRAAVPPAPAAAAKPAEAELEFKAGYVVFPSGSIYVSKSDPTKVFVGIGFDWFISIQAKGENLYSVRQQSYPPPRFTVTTYGSRYMPAAASLGAGQVYATMATTAFDDFSKVMVTHFGIPTSERPNSPIAAPSAMPTASENTAPPPAATHKRPVRTRRSRWH